MRELFNEYWRVWRAAKEAAIQAEDSKRFWRGESEWSRNAQANADRWHTRLSEIAAKIEAASSGEVVVDGSLPAPEVLPRNVVPFPGA